MSRSGYFTSLVRGFLEGASIVLLVFIALWALELI